jgi:hypothetical protein
VYGGGGEVLNVRELVAVMEALPTVSGPLFVAVKNQCRWIPRGTSAVESVPVDGLNVMEVPSARLLLRTTLVELPADAVPCATNKVPRTKADTAVILRISAQDVAPLL